MGVYRRGHAGSGRDRDRAVARQLRRSTDALEPPARWPVTARVRTSAGQRRRALAGGPRGRLRGRTLAASIPAYLLHSLSPGAAALSLVADDRARRRQARAR